jgi:hypothetical protein
VLESNLPNRSNGRLQELSAPTELRARANFCAKQDLGSRLSSKQTLRGPRHPQTSLTMDTGSPPIIPNGITGAPTVLSSSSYSSSSSTSACNYTGPFIPPPLHSGSSPIQFANHTTPNAGYVLSKQPFIRIFRSIFVCWLVYYPTVCDVPAAEYTSHTQQARTRERLSLSIAAFRLATAKQSQIFCKQFRNTLS